QGDRRGGRRSPGGRLLGQEEGRSLLAAVAQPVEEGGDGPEVSLLPRRERVVVALGTLQLHAEEEPGAGGGEEARLRTEALAVGSMEGALGVLRSVPLDGERVGADLGPAAFTVQLTRQPRREKVALRLVVDRAWRCQAVAPDRAEVLSEIA